MTITGFLHPGAMGASVAAACSGECLWAGEGRSAATRRRADDAGLVDAGSLAGIVERADTIVSVCPPDQAAAVAVAVADRGFAGVYVDANAIAPQQALEIHRLFAGQAEVVDGGIIGPPASQSGTTRMYLSGRRAVAIAERWHDSALDVRVVGPDVGSASALKMAFAGWTKGSMALLLTVNAVADSYGVAGDLAEEWSISQPDALGRLQHLGGAAAKAWRFEGEMREIAETFAAVGLPDGFHEAAAEVYHRLAGFKDTGSVTLDALVAALNAPN